MKIRSLGAVSAALLWGLASGPPGSAESPEPYGAYFDDASECQTLASQQTGGLIPNGSFEDDSYCYSPDGGGSDILQVPTGWQLSSHEDDYNGTDIRVLCDDTQAGQKSLRITTRQTSAELIREESFEGDRDCSEPDDNDFGLLQVPIGWQLAEAEDEYLGTDIRILCDDNTPSGSGYQSLRITTQQASTSLIELSDPIYLEAGQPYTIRSHYRIEEVTGAPKGRLYLQALYRDAAGDPIYLCDDDPQQTCQEDRDCDSGSCNDKGHQQAKSQLSTDYNPQASAEWRSHEMLIQPPTYTDRDGYEVGVEFIVLRLARNSAFEGTIAIDEISVERGSEAAGTASIKLSKPIKVKTGRSYRMRSNYRVENADCAMDGAYDPNCRFYLQALYRDASGDPIYLCNDDPERTCLADGDCDGGSCGTSDHQQAKDQLITDIDPKSRVGAAWHQHERIIRPRTYLDRDGNEVAAESIVLRLVENTAFEGTMAFDDISLEEMLVAELGELPGAGPEDSGPRSFAYDIVHPENKENPTAGFDALPFFEPLAANEEGCGFYNLPESADKIFRNPSPPDTIAAPYPATLLGQNIARNYDGLEIECRLESNTAYDVSVYMGGYWSNTDTLEEHRITFTRGSKSSLVAHDWGTCVGGGKKDGRKCREKDPGNDIDDCACEGEAGCSDGTCKQTDRLEDLHFAHVDATLVNPDIVRDKGFAIYDKYIWPRRYDRHDFAVPSGSDMLKMKIWGYVSGLVLIPRVSSNASNPAPGGRAALDAFDDDMRGEFVSRWATFVEPEDTGIPVVKGDYLPRSEDSTRGYVLFRRHWMDFVEYSSRPYPDDVYGNQNFESLQVSAAKGEYEPVTFSIWPQEDLHNVTVTASDLTSASGDTISSSAVRIWYLQQRPHRLKGATTFTLLSGYLPDWNVRNLYRGITQRAWISVKVPGGEETAAGTYRGEIRLSHDRTKEGGSSTTIPLEVTVLDFELVRPKRTHVMRRSPGNWSHLPGGDAAKEQFTKLAYKDLAEHGFTPETYAYWTRIVKPNDPDSGFTVNWGSREGSRLDKVADLLPKDTDTLWLEANTLKKLGSFNPESNDWTDEHTRSWLKAVQEHFGPGEGGKGFRKIYVHASAEESHYTGDKWLDFLAEVRRSREDDVSPNVFSTHTFNTSDGQNKALTRDGGVVDFPALGIFHGTATPGSSYSPTEQIENANLSNAESFFLYGLPGRMAPGFYLSKAKATGSFNEFYARSQGVRNNDWDNEIVVDHLGVATGVLAEAPGHSAVTFSNSGRILGSWYWEEIREGVDDDAYMNTLQHWIDKTADDPRPQVQAARAAAIEARDTIESQIDLNAIGQDAVASSTPEIESEESRKYEDVFRACMAARGQAVN